jgi:hypothetical protein
MSLPSSNPHEDISVDVLGPRSLDLNLAHGPPMPWRCTHEGGCRRQGCYTLGPVIRVVGDVGRRLALVGHSISREDGARVATM